MIAVDTSALIAYLGRESEAEAIKGLLSSEDGILMSAGSLVEFLIVSQSRHSGSVAKELIEEFEIGIVPVTSDLAFAAGDAHRRYGRRNHAAALNFGDCFAYALAKARDLPLLYVGGDFAQTDVRSALS